MERHMRRYSHISEQIAYCPDDCPYFKGEHDYCFTPFIPMKTKDGEFIPFCRKNGCAFCRISPVVIHFDTRKERDEYKTKHPYKYRIDINRIKFDFNAYTGRKNSKIGNEPTNGEEDGKDCSKKE